MIRRLARAFRESADTFRRSIIEAGGTGQRWGANSAIRTPNRALLAQREMASARATALALNSPLAASIINNWATILVGDGPVVRPTTDDQALRKMLVSRWSQWWDHGDGEGIGDLGTVLSRAVKEMVRTGDAFVAMTVDREEGLRLSLLQSDQVDASLSRPLPDGGRVIAGVEFNSAGKRVAFWVKSSADQPFAIVAPAQRVPASEMLHLFVPPTAGAVRGISWLSPSMTTLNAIAQLQDALLAQANTAALFSGFVRNLDPSGTSPIDGMNGTANGNGFDVSMEPGALVNLPVGADVTFNAPPRLDAPAEFLKAMQHTAAAGVGLPYELITGDLKDVSFISGRLGRIDLWTRVRTLQKTILEPQLLRPLWRKWLLVEGLTGQIDMAVALTADAEFLLSQYSEIDPGAETKADALAVERGFKSRQEVIAKRGRDPEAVDAERAADSFKPAREVTA